MCHYSSQDQLLFMWMQLRVPTLSQLPDGEDTKKPPTLYALNLARLLASLCLFLRILCLIFLFSLNLFMSLCNNKSQVSVNALLQAKVKIMKSSR